jgi:cytochrome c oxidase subunit 2
VKRSTTYLVAGISAVTVALFVGLAYYGWAYRWGTPADKSIQEPATLAVPRLDRAMALDAPEAFDDALWKDMVAVELLHQVTSPPRGTHLVPSVDVRAFHDGANIYFLFEWPDDVESRVHDVGTWPDAVAVAFSLDEEPPEGSIMMGFQSVVNIWQWKADLDAEFWNGGRPQADASPNERYSYEAQAAFPERTARLESACQDILSGRPGTVTLQPKTAVAGRGRWRDGVWRVIITRPLTAEDPAQAVQLHPGTVYAAFGLWNGDKGDRGSRKSISEWVRLELAAAGESAAHGPAPSPAAEATAEAAGPDLLDAAAGVLTLVGDLLLGGTAHAAESTDPQPTARLIEINARRFQYEPHIIRVKRGERLTLRLQSLDVEHGLFIDGYDVNIQVEPGGQAEKTFVADRPGRYTFRCSVTCGEFHPYMVGYFVVGPNRRLGIFAGAALAVGVAGLGVAFRRRSAAATGGDATQQESAPAEGSGPGDEGRPA